MQSLARSPRSSAVLAAGLLWLLAAAAQAQPARQVVVGFERDVNSYRWNADLNLLQPVGAWELRLNNRFASDVFILFRDELSFRDENVLRWQARRPFSEDFSGGLRGRTSWFSQGRVFSQEVYGAVRFQPRSFMWLEPAVGAAWDQRPSAAPVEEGLPPLRMDAGPAYGLGLALTPPPLNGYQLRLDGLGTWQVINPRRGRTLHLQAAAERVFEEVEVLLTARAASLRRDTYQATSFLNRQLARRAETIEASTSDTLQAALQVNLPVYGELHLTGRVDLEAQHRTVRTLQAPSDALFFDTDFDRRVLDAEVTLRYVVPRLETSLTLQRGARVEERRLANRGALPPERTGEPLRSLRQADYDRGYLALHSRTQATLTPRLLLHVDGMASILRHDTPDINADDRDEAYFTGQLGLRWHFSRYLYADLQVFASAFHTVYLKTERSAENNQRRTLRLEPAVTWEPSARTRFRLGTAVRATYTVYDFVLPGRTPKDQSARELRYAAAFEHDFGGGLRLLADGSFNDLHLGRLIWDRFAEIPFDTLRTYSGHLRLQAGRRIAAEAGLRFFIRSDYERAVTVRYPPGPSASPLDSPRITRPGRKWIEQIGPTCALRWSMRTGATLRLEGWLTIQHIRYRLYGTLPEASADRIRRAARNGPRTVTPNMAMSVTWRF